MTPKMSPATLYDKHADAVFRFSLRLCRGCHADAEDLTQETFLAAIGSWKRFLGHSTVRTWLFRICLYRHQAQNRGVKPPQVALLETLPTHENLARQTTLRLTLSAALATLPDILHEAFVLVKCEGMTYKEAGVLLGVPQGTVQSRVHEACCRLRQQLTDLE
jgi:RNA polymerase sigma-70 factor, ECF subfamily